MPVYSEDQVLLDPRNPQADPWLGEAFTGPQCPPLTSPTCPQTNRHKGARAKITD